VVPGHIRQAEAAPDGRLGSVVADGGERVEGDLFFDCTGVEARLLAALGEAGWQSWSEWLPCDSVLTAVVDSEDVPPPFSLANAVSAGWLRSVPLRGRSALMSIYASAAVDEDEALAQLKRLAGERRLQELHRHYVRFGRREAPWRSNVVALGTAAALIDPVGVSNLNLLRSGIDLLLQLLPGFDDHGVDCAAESTEFNRRFGLLLEHARDFALAHYRLNGREGEPFWDACRAVGVPDSLDYKFRLYECRGRVPLYDEEPLDEDSWTQLFDEHGLRPRAYSPIADGFNTADLQQHVQLVRTVMLDAVAKMPTYADYLGRLS
jgi:tryptophan halogenase